MAYLIFGISLHKVLLLSKINFEESENFAKENHGAHATILSFAFNRNTCELREKSTHSFS